MRLSILAASALLSWSGATADDAAPRSIGELPARAYVAIIIDDMGDRLAEGRRALELPGPVAYAVLPHRAYSVELAAAADAAGREVLLHQPMEAQAPGPLGPGAVVLHSGHRGLRQALEDNLAAVPHVSGVNNHMGSQLTRHPDYMRWLMQILSERGDLYFVDSRTTAETRALTEALAHGVPATERNVFLDDDPEEAAVALEFQRLVDRALRDGTALGIGHPKAETLTVLERELPRLAEHGVVLVSPSRLIQLQRKAGAELASGSDVEEDAWPGS